RDDPPAAHLHPLSLHDALPISQRPQVERPAPDPLAGFRAGVERAEAAGGGLALDVAKAQLAVAQEFQAAGKDPRHHAAAIMQERSEEHTSELQSRENLVCRLLL